MTSFGNLQTLRHPLTQQSVKSTNPKKNHHYAGGLKSEVDLKGYGRKGHGEETADQVIPIDVGESCPECGGALRLKEVRPRAVIESEPTKPQKILYRLYHKQCSRCQRVFRAKAPAVLPKSLYGNQITTKVAVMHYFH